MNRKSRNQHPNGNWSRRGFLRSAAGTGLSLATAFAAIKSGFAESLQDMGPPTDNWHFDDRYWAKIRNQFMIEEGLAYMNNGTLGPTPIPVYNALSEYWRLMAVNPNENSNVLVSRIEDIRAKVAKFFGASPDEIAIMRNTTEGLNTVAQAFDWKQGDEILISFHEHAAHLRPWQLQAKRYGIIVRQVPFGTPPKSPDEIVDAFEQAITPRTRAIGVAFCTTITGCILPVKELAQLAHSKGLYCFADGAQTSGMIQYDLHDLGVDAFSTSGHKWLCGPAGTGILYVGQELIDRMWPNIVTTNWFAEKGARKFEQLSRRPWPVVAALEDTLDFQLSIGKQRIEGRVRALAGYFRREAAQIPGVLLYTSNDPRLAAGMTTLAVEGVPFRKLRNFLREKYEIYVSTQQRGLLYPAHEHGVDGIRVSTHYYNTFEQVDRLLEGISTAATARLP